jgi:predicted nuclease of restriction endonuclease-like (RecB) superfamily
MSRKQPTPLNKPVNELAGRITNIIVTARNRLQSVVDHEMVRAYWEIGREIVEDEQQGEKRAEYGKAVIEGLASDLTQRHGKGFTASNLLAMRRFYLSFPIQHALRAGLSWTHYRQLLKIEEQQKRSFYEIECSNNNWSTRELERQMNSMLFERLALSRDKEGIMSLAREGQVLREPSDLVKDPYVLEFLGLPQSELLYEKELGSALLEHIQNSFWSWARDFRLLPARNGSPLTATTSTSILFFTTTSSNASC